MIKPYNCARKGRKWYRKLAFHLMQQAQYNAWVLYTKDSGRMSYINFQKDLINSLLFEKVETMDLETCRNEHVCRLTERHFLSEIGRQSSNRAIRKQCRVCYKKGVRKDVPTHCTLCPSKPGLCIQCMELYHTKLAYWK